MPRYRCTMTENRKNNHYNNGCTNENAQSNRGCMNENIQSNCGCMVKDDHADYTQKMVLAMAYVPWQHWGKLYDLNQAFMEGTIFVDLNKPFRGTGGCCNGR